MKETLNTLANSDFFSKCTNYIYTVIHTFITCQIQLFHTDSWFAADLSILDDLKCN